MKKRENEHHKQAVPPTSPAYLQLVAEATERVQQGQLSAFRKGQQRTHLIVLGLGQNVENQSACVKSYCKNADCYTLIKEDLSGR